jgi:hypothetical protein
MIAHSIQISELIPDTFVRIILNTGKQIYGFILDSTSEYEQMVVVSRPDSTENLNEMSFETIDTNTVLSIDPYMK